jgi:hypothetical protein
MGEIFGLGSSDNRWQELTLTQNYNESNTQFALRMDRVNHYRGGPEAIMRRNSNPRDNYHSVTENIIGVSGRNDINVAPVESGGRRGSYHIHLTAGPTGKVAPQNNERRRMPFAEAHSPGQFMPTTDKKPGFLRTLRGFLSCLIPCMANRKTNH